MSNRFHSSGYRPLQKFKVILSGLRVAVISDFSVAYKVILSVPVLGVSFLLRQWVDVTVILLTMGLMLISELFNSAIEVLCDLVEPQQNEQIRVTKDIAAAAAGLSILVWGAVLTIEIIRLVQVQ
jgi:diacylglycerol kinase